VRVLQSLSRLVIELRRVRPQDEHGDRELVEPHQRILLRPNGQRRLLLLLKSAGSVSTSIRDA